MRRLVPAFTIPVLTGAALVLSAAPSIAAPSPAVGAIPAQAVSWRCEGDQCGGDSPHSPTAASLMRECVKVVSVIGPVSRYESRGRALSDHDLAQCNRRATRTPVGQ